MKLCHLDDERKGEDESDEDDIFRNNSFVFGEWLGRHRSDVFYPGRRGLKIGKSCKNRVVNSFD